jgi:hypothetical protein
MHSTNHITPDMMRSALERAFQSAVTQHDKDSAKHLRSMLLATRNAYDSVLFDILKLTTGADKTTIAEMAFLTGMQAGFELGIQYPPAP